MSQEDLNWSGIYFLASRFLDGSYIYKVGKSENIAKRIKQYPQNFELKLHIECLNRHVSEREVIQVVDRLEDSGIVKCGQGNEFFRSETDKIKEIEYAIYKWYFVTERTRTREITREDREETQIQSIVKSSPTLPACRGYDEIMTNKHTLRFINQFEFRGVTKSAVYNFLNKNDVIESFIIGNYGEDTVIGEMKTKYRLRISTPNGRILKLSDDIQGNWYSGTTDRNEQFIKDADALYMVKGDRYEPALPPIQDVDKKSSETSLKTTTI